MSQPARAKAQSFAEVLERASGYNGEPLAANMITRCMPYEQKNQCVEAYNEHIETGNREGELHERAVAACFLLGRPDLHHKVYELLLSPLERV